MWSQLASLASQVSETVAPVAQEFKEALREDDSSAAAEVPEQSSSGAGWLSTVAGSVKGIQEALADSDEEEDQTFHSPEPSKIVDPFAEPEFHFKNEKSASSNPSATRVPPATSLWGMVSSVKGALQEFQEALQEESDQEERSSETSEVAEASNERTEEEGAIEVSDEEPVDRRINELDDTQYEIAHESSALYEDLNISFEQAQEQAVDSNLLTVPLEDKTLETSEITSGFVGSDEQPWGNEQIESSEIESGLPGSDERPMEIEGTEKQEIDSRLDHSNEQIEEAKHAEETPNIQSAETLQVDDHTDTMAIDSFKKEEIEYAEEAKDTSSGNSSIVNVEVGEIMKSTEQGTVTPEDFELVADESSDGLRSDARLVEAGDTTTTKDESTNVPNVLPPDENKVATEENQATEVSEPVSIQEPTPSEDVLAMESIPPETVFSPHVETASPDSTVAVNKTQPDPGTAIAESASALVSPRSGGSGNRRNRRGQQKRQSAEHQVSSPPPHQSQPQAANLDNWEKEKVVQSNTTNEKLSSPPNSRSQKKSRGRGNQKPGATSASSPTTLQSPTNVSAVPQLDAPAVPSEATVSPKDNLLATDGSPSLANKDDAATTELSAPRQPEQAGELWPPPTDSIKAAETSAKEEAMIAEITKLKAELEGERSARLSGAESSKSETERMRQEVERLHQDLEREKGLRQKGLDEAAQKEKAAQMALQELQKKHSQAMEAAKSMTDRIKSMETENKSVMETLQKTMRSQMSEIEKNLARVVAEKANLQKELVAAREALENATRSSDKQRETNRALAEKAIQSEQAQQQEIERLAALLREKESHIARSEESSKQHTQVLRNEVSRLESELAKLASLQQDLDFALAENASLREKAESLASKAELDLALQEVESLRSELARRESVHLQRVQVLEAELEATKADVTSLATSSETAKSEIDKLRKALMRTTADLEKEESSHRQKISAMRAEMSRAKDEHEAELAKAAEKQDELRQEIGRLRDEIAALKRSISVSSSATAAENVIDPRVISNLVFAFVKRGRENGDNGRKEVVETMARMLEWTEAQRQDVMSSLTPSATASTSAVVARGFDLLLSSSNAAESKSDANRKKSVLTTEVAAKLLERESFEDVFFKEFLAKESSGANASRRGSLTKPAGEVQPKTPLSSRALNRSDTSSPLPVLSPTTEKAKSVSEKLSEEGPPSIPSSPVATVNKEG